MSLLLPTMGLAYTGIIYTQNRDKQIKKNKEKQRQYTRTMPYQGVFTEWSKTSTMQKSFEDDQIVRVTPEIDVRGLPVFLVDYKNGTRAYSYLNPLLK